MKGLQFLVDDKKTKSAILIDLTRHAHLWDDPYDFALARDREKEPWESLESVTKRVQREKLRPGR